MKGNKQVTFSVNENGCHICTSHKPGNHGYPRTAIGLLSRQVIEQKYGKLPKNTCVLHKCDNRMCINIEHLFLGTRGDNNRDRHAKGRTSILPRTNGRINGMCKLNEEQVIEIRLSKGAVSTSVLGNLYKVSQSHICSIQNKKLWRHL